MKTNTWIMFALIALTTGVAAHAEEVQNTVATASEDSEALTADELAFAAKLNDQNRKAFHSALVSPERRAVMIAVKNGANADLAVQKMLDAKDMKHADAVADAEE